MDTMVSICSYAFNNRLNLFGKWADQLLDLADFFLEGSDLFHAGNSFFRIVQTSLKGRDGLPKASADFRQLLSAKDQKGDPQDNNQFRST